MTTSYDNFAYTLPRLLGLHNLSGAKAAELLGMTPQHMWMLLNKRNKPTYERLRAIDELFGIKPDRLVDAPFEELLQAELADPVRYRETEERIAAREAQKELGPRSRK